MDWNFAGISLFIVAVKKKIVKVIVRGVLIKKKTVFISSRSETLRARTHLSSQVPGLFGHFVNG